MPGKDRLQFSTRRPPTAGKCCGAGSGATGADCAVGSAGADCAVGSAGADGADGAAGGYLG